ncbi:YbaB/EbfC family nucleoid-associated protein [Nocardia noduli]|uniref:YbaB/EbfC family nucleoid-associated protein n=1 Tax=Nocardia noduli TaxID=2815722 RepID=UPI0020B28270|nr:YbaB/EbfC family nucleoid-associated protein [Nocardia noduli]
MGDRNSETDRIERLQTAVVRAKGTASSSDGAVTVTVGANGALYAIDVGDAAARLSARGLADVVVELHKTALRRAGDAVREAIEDPGREESPREDALPVDRGDDAVPGTSDPAVSDDSDLPTDIPGPQEMSLSGVIEPFDARGNDDDRYFTATPEPVPPRRTPRSVAATRANEPTDDCLPSVTDIDHQRSPAGRTTRASEVGDATPVSGWLDSLSPEFLDDVLDPIFDRWDDWDLGTWR